MKQVKMTREKKIAASKAARKTAKKTNPTQTDGGAAEIVNNDPQHPADIAEPPQNVVERMEAEMETQIPVIELPVVGGTAVEIARVVTNSELRYLADEAFAQRKEDVKNPAFRSIAADHIVRSWAEKLATETNRDLAISPITLQEYTDYRDTAVATKAAAPAASRTFTSATFETVVRPLSNQGLKNRLFAKFAGREGVDIDETLLALAEMFAASETGRKTNTKVDGGVEVCTNPACPTVPDKKFVPTTFERLIKPRHEGEDGELRTEGQYLAISGELKPYCRACKSAVINGIFKSQDAWRASSEEERTKTPFPKMIRFLSRADAQTHADRQAYAIGKQAEEDNRDRERQEENERHKLAIQKGALGTLAALQVGRPTNRLSEETRKKSHLNVGEALSGDPSVEGVFSATGNFNTQNGNKVQTFVAIRFHRGDAEVLEAGRILNVLVGKSGSSNNLPPLLRDFLKQIQERS